MSKKKAMYLSLIKDRRYNPVYRKLAEHLFLTTTHSIVEGRDAVPFRVPHKQIFELEEHMREAEETESNPSTRSEPLGGFQRYQNQRRMDPLPIEFSSRKEYDSFAVHLDSPSSSEYLSSTPPTPATPRSSSSAQTYTSEDRVKIYLEDHTYDPELVPETLERIYRKPHHHVAKKMKRQEKEADTKGGGVRFGAQRKKRPLIRRDRILDEHCQLVKKMSMSEGFVYMVTSVSRADEAYTPYALKIVPYDDINRKVFVTLSPTGVTQHWPKAVVFTSMKDWKRQYAMYRKLIKLPFFEDFRLWKGVMMWIKAIKWTKYAIARTLINAYLFMLNRRLGIALLTIQDIFCKIDAVVMTDFRRTEGFAFFDFIERQCTFEREIQHFCCDLDSAAKAFGEIPRNGSQNMNKNTIIIQKLLPTHHENRFTV